MPAGLYTHFAFLALSATLVASQSGFVPLASKRFTWPDVPYKVDTDVGLIRGDQHGYNKCNASTENQQSLCQTAHFNSINDFCLWAPPEPGHEVGDIEGIMVAWCTKPGHGTRLIPAGAITGVEWMKTPDYVQVVGFIDQTKINMLAGDSGGEMDPHGADRRGNPMGGIMFSNAYSGGSNVVQVVEWHNFMGNNMFCLKACDPAGKDDHRFCEHKLDRIGCYYNAPSNAQNNVFVSCEGDNQDFPGVYTRSDGVVTTYNQPYQGELTIPYLPKVPPSSSCVTHTSSLLYTGLPGSAAPPAQTGVSDSIGSGSSTPAPGPSASSGTNGTPSRSDGNSPRQSGETEPDSAQGLAGFSAVSLLTVFVSAFLLA